MKRVLLIPFIFLIFAFNCKKKNKPPESPPVTVVEKPDSLYFVFVNKIGYKNDSISIGNSTFRYLFAVDIESGFYNANTNKSDVRDVIYARNSLFLLRDSIMQISYSCSVNYQFNLKVSLSWNSIKGSLISRVRDLTYQLNTHGNDTVKTKGNKIIKFVWPDDTASGKFTKTYDGP